MDSETNKDIAMSSSSFNDESTNDVIETPTPSSASSIENPQKQEPEPEPEKQSESIVNMDIEEEEEEEDDDDIVDNEETLYKKILNTIKTTSMSHTLIEKHHALRKHNEEEVRKLITVVRNKDGDIIDNLHKTTPIMTKYEKTRILGKRCLQLENGDMPYVDLSEYEDEILDDLFIAKLEMSQRKLPFIIRRPLPNGSSEYWKISDLELI